MLALISRGFSRLLGRRSGLNRRPDRFRLSGHQLEPRRLLTGDAALLGFDALGDSLRIQYSAGDSGDADLRLALYASPDGSAAGAMLHSVPLSREAGEAAIAGHLLNLAQNELLLARLESAVDDVSESIVLSQMGLQGGVIQDADGVLHVFGGAGTDIIGIYEFGVLGVSFNGAYYSYGLETVADVTLHDVGPDDVVSMNGDTTSSEALDEGDAGDGSGGELIEGNTQLAEGEGSGDGTGGGESGGGTGGESTDGTGGESTDGTGGEAPVMESILCYEHSTNVWMVEGTVSDDGPTGDLTVSLGYWGEYETTNVDGSGAFSHAFYFEPGTFATVDAYAVDGEGLESDWVGCYIDNDTE